MGQPDTVIWQFSYTPLKCSSTNLSHVLVKHIKHCLSVSVSQLPGFKREASEPLRRSHGSAHTLGSQGPRHAVPLPLATSVVMTRWTPVTTEGACLKRLSDLQVCLCFSLYFDVTNTTATEQNKTGKKKKKKEKMFLWIFENHKMGNSEQAATKHKRMIWANLSFKIWWLQSYYLLQYFLNYIFKYS